nr:MFS transporter [Kineococcus aurantiacus]
MAVLGAVLIAPVQPSIARAFAGQPGVDVLVPLSLTVPAVAIALLAPVAGRTVDRVGRLRVLTASLVLYSVFGTAPLWLDSLPAVVVSRALVGVAEAGVMTCCTTLLGDLFEGARRNRYFGLQTVATSLSAVVFIAAGGALAAGDWRTPFWLYAVGVVGAVAVRVLLREPAPRRTGALPPLDARALRLPLLVTLGGGLVFYTPIVELSYALDALGVGSSATIGAVSAAAAVATCVGAASFARLAPRGSGVLLPVAFTLAGAGLVGVALAGSVPVVLLGAAVASAGTGLLLPSLLTWALGGLDLDQRGRATGWWTAALFAGEFACPLLVLALTAALGSLSPALGGVALLAVLLAAVTWRTAEGHRRRG